MKSQVMDNVRNLGYVSGQIGVEKVDRKQSSDRISRGRESVFDIQFSSAAGNGVLAGKRQPIRSEYSAGARRQLHNNRSASS